MNYFDYLCGIYEICFRTPAKLNAAESPKLDEPKFYDYSERPIAESFVGANALNVLSANSNKKSAITSAKVEEFYKSDWDITPKTCGGDWLLRYSPNETNFNPWKFNTKFSHFDLVPWRQQNKQIDLENAIGWEPFQLTSANQQQLRILQKFETARSKRIQKQRLKTQRDRFRRQIKIRFILSLEVHQKKMKLFRPTSRTSTASQQRKLVLQRNRQLFVFNENAYELAEHWGYFSQRNKGVEEMLVTNASQLDLTRVQKSITYHRPSSTSSNQSRKHSSSNGSERQQQSSETNSIQLTCANCRCVFMFEEEFRFLLFIFYFLNVIVPKREGMKRNNSFFLQRRHTNK